MPRLRIIARKDRGGWTVADTDTSEVWTGLTQAGAESLRRHLTRAREGAAR